MAAFPQYLPYCGAEADHLVGVWVHSASASASESTDDDCSRHQKLVQNMHKCQWSGFFRAANVCA